MERVYRWVAAFQMINDRPFFGFGPGNFYNFYKDYTVTSFRTYVSDNPERSGVHNYYLMTLVEQGYFGLIIFIGLVFFVLLYGEQVYHQTQSAERKRIVMTALLTILVILGLQLINDLLETDKIGPFFFFSLAMLVNADIANRKERKEFQSLL
jgi:O-antigen ligase